MKRFNQKGSLHLVGVLAVVVIAAVAVIGVKVLNTSNANPLPSNLITITSPKTTDVINSYKVLTATAKPTERKVTRVTFFVDGKLVADAGMDKCYSHIAIPTLAPRTYAVCADTWKYPNGLYSVTAKMSFLNKTAVTSYPIKVTISNPDIKTPISVSFVQPLDGAIVRGYVPVVVKASSAISRSEFTVNLKPAVVAEMSKCYPTAVPQITPDSAAICLNTDDPVYAGTSILSLSANVYDSANGAGSTKPIAINHPTTVPVPVPTQPGQ